MKDTMDILDTMDGFDKLLEEVERLIDKRFPAARTDGAYHRCVARDLARKLVKRCNEVSK